MILKCHILNWPIQSPDRNLLKQVFHLLNIKQKAPQNKQEEKMATAQAWQSITREDTKYCADCGLMTSAIDYKRTFIQY